MAFSATPQRWDPKTTLEIQDHSQGRLTCSGTCRGWDRDGKRCRIPLTEIAREEIDEFLRQLGAMDPSDIVRGQGRQLLQDLAFFTLCEGPRTPEGRANRDFRGHRSQDQIDTLVAKWKLRVGNQSSRPRNDSGYSSASYSSQSTPRRHAAPSQFSAELEGSLPSLRAAQSYGNLHGRHQSEPYNDYYVPTHTSPSASNLRYESYRPAPEYRHPAAFASSYNLAYGSSPAMDTGYVSHTGQNYGLNPQYIRPKRSFLQKLFGRRR